MISFLGGLKKLGKGVLKGLKFAGKYADFIPIPGVPARAIPLIKAALGVAEAKGGKAKAQIALTLVLPALAKAGIELPVKKVNLALEVLLDEEINEGHWEFNVSKAVEVVKVKNLDKQKLQLVSKRLPELAEALDFLGS